MMASCLSYYYALSSGKVPLKASQLLELLELAGADMYPWSAFCRLIFLQDVVFTFVSHGFHPSSLYLPFRLLARM